jgi:pimeloyl-ACP methyl ester carboxylesterase
VRYDVDWSDLDYMEDSSWLAVPTLVVHGSEDETVPVTLSRTLAAAHPDEVDLVVVPDAGHVASWNDDPDRYDAAFAGFLKQH